MQRNNCQLAEYEAWFLGECNKLNLDPGCVIVGPFTDPCGDPDSAPWNSDFAIIYSDGMYIRVKEYYRQLTRCDGGGGCLRDFSYHYGICSDARDSNGFPFFIEQFELRIDIDPRNKRHIHYMKENHIPEARLPGLNFDSIDPFEFIRAVEKHRRSLMPLHEILRFKVVHTK